MHILLVKNLNPFSLHRKISDKFKQEMIYTLWRECIPTEFYGYICQEENFKYLNGRDVSQPGVLEIVGRFIDQDKSNLRMFQQNLADYKDIFQYVYSHTFPEIYSMSEKRGIDLKRNFLIFFKTYKDKQRFDIISSLNNRQTTRVIIPKQTNLNKSQFLNLTNLQTRKNTN